MEVKNQRLIELGFPCHQVGAETQRERDTGKAPPVNRLHVWWARRPLTPSRAAVIASLDSADTDPEVFVRKLGIERVQALVNGEPWALTGDLLKFIQRDGENGEYLLVDEKVLGRLKAEEDRRAENREFIVQLKEKEPTLDNNAVLIQWEAESQPLPKPWPKEGESILVQRVMGDPAWYKNLMQIAQQNNLRVPNLYGYERAFSNTPNAEPTNLVVLDPTAGGGSIPFEALRLGHSVIANELNPVATVILHATLKYPALFGLELTDDIKKWGQRLLETLDEKLAGFFPRVRILPDEELIQLKDLLQACPEYISEFNKEQVTTYLYTRQVTCPHCSGEAPLLNTCWLSKEAKDP